MLQHVDSTTIGTPHRGERMATAALQTEIGWIEVSADNEAITHLFWRGVQPARLLVQAQRLPKPGLATFLPKARPRK